MTKRRSGVNQTYIVFTGRIHSNSNIIQYSVTFLKCYSIFCHISQMLFNILSYLSNVLQYSVISLKCYSIFCHISQMLFNILSHLSNVIQYSVTCFYDKQSTCSLLNLIKECKLTIFIMCVAREHLNKCWIKFFPKYKSTC
jgi:hypothetical protein